MEKVLPFPLKLPHPLPKTFALVPGRWRNATGGKKRWSVPRRGWRTARLVLLRHKKRPVTTTGRFCIDRVGDRAGRVSSTACHAIHFRQLRAGTPGDRRTRGGLGPAKRISKREEPGQFLTGLLSSGGPSSEDGDLHADRKKRFWKGGGKADQGRARYDEGSYGHRELAGGRTFSPKRCPSPSAFPLSLTLRPTAVPDRCRAGRLRDRRPGGRGRLRQRPCR